MLCMIAALTTSSSQFPQKSPSREHAMRESAAVAENRPNSARMC